MRRLVVVASQLGCQCLGPLSAMVIASRAVNSSAIDLSTGSRLLRVGRWNCGKSRLPSEYP